MTWIVQNRRAWRAAILAIAAVAFVGPWAFESLWVPAEYVCPSHTFRLDSNYCGSPVTGVFIFLWIINGPIEMARALALSEVDRALKIFSMVLALTLVLLPLLTTFVLIIGRDRRSRFQVAAWVLAATAAPFLSLVGLSGFYPALWGIWLYFGLAISALALELAAFIAEKKLSPG